MKSYEARLDRIEAALAPTHDLHIVTVHVGQTIEEAQQAYATERRLMLAEVRGTVVYLTSYVARPAHQSTAESASQSCT
jgi:hypothetical protein